MRDKYSFGKCIMPSIIVSGGGVVLLMQHKVDIIPHFSYDGPEFSIFRINFLHLKSLSSAFVNK